MNECKIDDLLEQKKSQPMPSFSPEDEFKEQFFDRLEQQNNSAVYVWLRIAAGFIICAFAAALFIAADRNKISEGEHHQITKMKEMLKLFGNDSAILTVGGELFTAERNFNSPQENFVNFKLAVGRKRVELALACADNDTLYLDDPGLKGTVTVSRSDRLTLVLDVELEVNRQKVKTVVALEDKGGKCFTS